MEKFFGIAIIVVIAVLALFSLRPGDSNFVRDFLYPKATSSTQPNRASHGSETPPSPLPPAVEPPPQEEPYIDPSEIPEGFSRSQLSRYFHKIRINFISPGSPEDYSQASLGVSYGAGEGKGINVTGWKLQARKGYLVIPRAVGVYTPSRSEQGENIWLQEGNTLNIYSTSSPAGNFKINKCMGYLEQSLSFSPPLYAGCPGPEQTRLSYLSSECQDYIVSLPYCGVPDPNQPGLLGDRECRAYLDELNYQGCFYRHRSDEDFLSREWRVWMGAFDRPRTQYFEYRHDRVLLLDQYGLLVDLYVY